MASRIMNHSFSEVLSRETVISGDDVGAKGGGRG